MTEQSQLLNKIAVLTKKVQNFLSEIGCSEREKAKYFASRVFDCSDVHLEAGDVSQFYKLCIEATLKKAQEKKESPRICLTHILTKLEIEHGQIEKYENELSSQQTTYKLLEQKRDLFNENGAYRARRLFDSGLNKEEQSEARMTRDLDQIRSFERELQESLMKTKLLKRLIQQRLT